MSGDHTPTPWKVRSPERNGEIADHFVIADDVNGYPYDAEILGEDEYREQSGGLSRKLADCELIVTAVNSYASSQAEIERLRAVLEAAFFKIVGLELASAVEANGWKWPDDAPRHIDIVAEALRAALSGSKE
jgi:hypothetical protein